MHSYLKGALIGTAVSYSALGAAQQVKEHSRPNVLLILADDLGYGDLSCQGATDLKTPNIDRIFQEGIKFNNCYANCTVCSPSRAALLTGCYPDLVGVPGVTPANPVDGISFVPTLMGQQQPGEARTVYFMRREGGPPYGGQIYYSALSGQYKIVQNTPWEEMQFFNLDSDPYEKQSLKKKEEAEYRQLFTKLTRHISLSGAVPWKSPAQAKKLLTTGN